MIIGEFIERNARCFGDHPAIWFEGRTVTHREFAQRVRQLIGALAQRGYPQQTRLAVLSRNCPEYLEVYGAAGLGGYIGLGLNYRLSALEQMAILRDAGPAVLFFEEAYKERVLELRPHLAEGALLVCLDGSNSESWYTAYKDLLAESTGESLAMRAKDEDTFLLIYTSGTTGTPKGVMLGNHAQLEQTRSQALTHSATQDDRMLIVMPFYHIGGPSELFTYQIVGATIMLHRQFDAHAVLQSIQDRKVTSAHLAPTMISMLLDVQEQTPYDVSSLHTVCYASAPMSVVLSIRARQVFGPIFMQIYGMTEAGLGATLLKHQHVLEGNPQQRARLASAGQPYLGTALRILGDDGQELAMGEVGEVCFSSASVMQGYWRNPEASALTLQSGLLHTGDMGYLDQDGYLFIVDRKKDMIISGGENIYSREVEEALLMHPAVLEVAVVGIPDAKWGETVLAAIVARPGLQVEDSVLDVHCSGLIAAYKRPRAYKFLDTLPRVPSTNKVDKRALRAPYWAGETRNVS